MKFCRAIFSVLLVVGFVVLSGSGCGNDNSNNSDSDCGDALCIGVLSSKNNFFGDAATSGVELARDDINAAGGNIKLIEGDHDMVEKSVKDFIKKGVDGIVGPVFSSRSVQILTTVTDNGLVTVSPSATSPSITKFNAGLMAIEKQNFFFRTAASDVFQADLLTNLTEGKTLIVYRDDNYGKNLTDLIEEKMKMNDRTPLKVSYKEHEHDDPMADEIAKETFEKIKALDGIEDVVSVIMVTFEEGWKLVNLMLDSAEISSDAKYYLSDGMSDAMLSKDATEQDDLSKYQGFKGVGPASYSDADRLAKFEARIDREETPSISFASHAYDALVLIALASLAAESTDPLVYVKKMVDVSKGGTKCESYEKCSMILSEDSSADINYEGLSGPVDFDENGDITKTFYSVYTYDNKGAGAQQIFRFPGFEEVTK